MKLLFVRHGDPDYAKDSLTPSGWKEAELLSEYLSSMKIDEIYESPLGRAKDTARATLEKTGMHACQKEWMREFHAPIQRPYPSEDTDYCWDWLPSEWTKYPEFYGKDTWMKGPGITDEIRAEYSRVCTKLDELLAEHGYTRDGLLYHTEEGNHRTLVCFCHYGVTIVFLSHLLNISPMPMWHGFVSAPTGITEVVTEERVKGIVSWRMQRYGDISHLAGKREPSFAARFCECYEDDTRH